MTHGLHTFDLGKHAPSSTIKMLACLLERITKTNDKLVGDIKKPMKRTPYISFHAQSLPTIDIEAYLTRILKYCPCANECFLSLLVYFDRMSTSGLRIDSYNIHRLMITGIMVSSKYFSDVFYTNTRYAKVGGIPVTELNALELTFLKLNNFNLNISLEELELYGDQLLEHWIREKRRSLQHSTNQPISTKRSSLPIGSPSPISPTATTTTTTPHSRCSHDHTVLHYNHALGYERMMIMNDDAHSPA
ncbi:cyclin-domain-containing protein [Halteromyces radiatus]|uniref:cyclin-domain-containing protein n=1 Tax=Halteromyces radiatus TaxID=101107 RepID=UPI00222075D3|nr:cyclin-domain-containing protein [Halteromyces radiatus]KAI8078624.1 cyclin-domain-containing protein [Halteromyces radiatus]